MHWNTTSSANRVTVGQRPEEVNKEKTCRPTALLSAQLQIS